MYLCESVTVVNWLDPAVSSESCIQRAGLLGEVTAEGWNRLSFLSGQLLIWSPSFLLIPLGVAPGRGGEGGTILGTFAWSRACEGELLKTEPGMEGSGTTWRTEE